MPRNSDKVAGLPKTAETLSIGLAMLVPAILADTGARTLCRSYPYGPAMTLLVAIADSKAVDNAKRLSFFIDLPLILLINK